MVACYMILSLFNQLGTTVKEYWSIVNSTGTVIRLVTGLLFITRCDYLITLFALGEIHPCTV